jgi:glycosyltransferase involved in cell wall biosynthesis
MFEPLLRFLDSPKPDPNIWNPFNHATEEVHLFDALFDRSPVPLPSALHNLTLSAYTDYVRHRLKQDYLFDVSFARSEYDGFLKLYIETYGENQGDQRAPLSAGEIKYLVEPIRRDDTEFELPRIAAFVLPSGERCTLDQFIYWWSVEKSRELFVEDCLIPESYVSNLRSTLGDLQEYALSKFMQTFVSRNCIFNGMRRGDARGRAVIYFVVLLYGLRMPHLMSFMPSRWLAEMFRVQGGVSLFDEISVLIFGNPDVLTAKKYIDYMMQIGYYVPAQTFVNFTARGHRVFAVARSASKSERYDVQVIGPFGRTFGLGESCRLVGRSIEALGYKTNFVDFDMGALSPYEAAKYERAVAPARVNILHINAETIPAAVAYLPDVFSKACNIGIAYWELTFPSDCQMLGLRLMDEMWAPSAFIETNLRPYCPSVIKIGMACAACRQKDRESRRRALHPYDIDDDEFVFLHTSDALSRAQRKNPVGVIRAFHTAFGPDEKVKLIIKTHNAGAANAINQDQARIWRYVREVATGDKRIVFVDETFSSDEQQMLIASADCCVSLHRAEGLGLDMLYAMGCGVPVLATAYSGNLDFCTYETSWLVGFRTVPVKPDEYPFAEPGHTWAEPNHEEAVAKMQEVFRNVSKRNELARNGQRLVAAQFSLRALSERVGARLNDLLSREATGE